MTECQEVAEALQSTFVGKTYEEVFNHVRAQMPGESYQIHGNVTESLWRLVKEQENKKMTVKFIEQDKSAVQLQTLNCGDAFEITGTYYIKSDEFGDDDNITVRCMYVSGSSIGYLAHIDRTAQVMPVTLVISRES